MTAGSPADDPTLPALRALRSRWALLSLLTVLYWLGNQGLRPFLPIRLQELGASDPAIGAAVAGYAVIGLLLAIPSGRMLDRLPQHQLLIAALLGLAVSTATMPLTRSVLVLSLLMLLNGAFGMWVWLLLQSMVTRAAEGEQRRRQLALFSLTWGIGLAGGPSVGALVYDATDFTWLCLIVSALTLVAALSGFAVPPVPPVADGDQEHDVAPGLRGALRRSLDNPILVTVLISSFINLFVFSMRISFYPVYLERAGVALTEIGLLLSVIGFSSLAVRGILPAVERRFGTLRILIWSTWSAILGAASIPLTTRTEVLIAGAVLIGIGLGANPPITVNLVAEHSDERDRGLAVGLRMVSNRAAQVTQPLVFGGIAGVVGLGLAFPLSGALLAVMTVWMSVRLHHYR
jgi:MFS family permease